MGFFDFVRKGKKEEVSELPEAEAMDVGIGSLKDAMEKRFAGRMAKEKEDAEELYDRIKFNLVHIRKLAGELEKKGFEKSDKTYAVVNMTKNNYAKRALSLLSGAPNVESFECPEMNEFSAKTGKILGELMNIPTKQAVLLTKYFKSESSKIVLKLKETEEARKKMDALLEGSALKIMAGVSDKADALSGLLVNAKDFLRHEIILEEKAKEKKKELEEMDKEKASFLTGTEEREFRETEAAVKKLEEERDALYGKINEELSAIKRPVKKLEHSLVAAESMDKEKLALFSRIAHSPSKVLFQDQGDSLIMGALIRLRGIGLKEEERERVEELIKKIELGYLSGLADKYKWLDGEIADKKAGLEKSAVPDRHKRHEREIENLRRDASELKKELDRSSASRAGLAEKIKSEKEKLEKAVLAEANVRLNVILDEGGNDE